MCAFIFWLLLSSQIIILEAMEDRINTVELFQCQHSKLETQKQFTLPSYPLFSQVQIKIRQENFPGCSSGISAEEINYDFRANDKQWDLDNFTLEEMLLLESGVSISPNGILAVKSHFYLPDEYCVVSYQKNLEVESPRLSLKYCPVKCSEPGGRTCIPKCCFTGKSLDISNNTVKMGCVPSGKEDWEASLYDANNYNKVSVTNASLKPHYYMNILDERTCPDDLEIFLWSPKEILRLLTNGKLLAFHFPNMRKKIEANLTWSPKEYCADGQLLTSSDISKTLENKESQVVKLCFYNFRTYVQGLKKLLTRCMKLRFGFSSFLLLTVFVYLLLWDKQKTYGWIVISLCMSQFFQRIFKGIATRILIHGDINQFLKTNLCVANAILENYFMMSSSIWMVVANIKIWLAFRRFKNMVVNSKYNNLEGLWYYSLAAWGIPLVFVVVGVGLDQTFLDELKPAYAKEFVCLVNDWKREVYLNLILAFSFPGLCLCFSIMTCKNLLKQKAASTIRNCSTAKDKTLMLSYGKLSFVTGIGSLFGEVSNFYFRNSSIDVQHWSSVTKNIIQLIFPLFTFAIFVCNRSVLKQLEDKFSTIKAITGKCKLIRDRITQFF